MVIRANVRDSKSMLTVRDISHIDLDVTLSYKLMRCY